MKENIYLFRFDASYLGGNALIKAITPEAAWKALQKKVEKPRAA